MNPQASLSGKAFDKAGAGLRSLRHLNRVILGWLARARHTLHFAAMMLSLVISPSTYRHDNRDAIARQLVTGLGANLLWFTVLCALVSVVLIRIVVVTALGYGLSKFALEMVVRVLVLELIPLTAAVFVALRCTLPDGVELAEMRRRGDSQSLQGQPLEAMQREVLPRVMAGVFSVLRDVVGFSLSEYLWVHAVGFWGLHASGRPGVQPCRFDHFGNENAGVQSCGVAHPDGLCRLR